MACDDHAVAARHADLGGEDEEAETDREMRHDERRKQHRLQSSLAAELVAVEGYGEGRADRERNRGRPAGDDQAVAEAGLKVLIGNRLEKPSP